MGMFNSIYSDIICPKTGKVCKSTEIQIKWQNRDSRILESYRLGDRLNDLLEEYNNSWIRTDFICDVCSKKTIGYKGKRFIKTDDQVRHFVFVKIENSVISEIIGENEFIKRNVDKFIKYD
jgi:hypothetical protein